MGEELDDVAVSFDGRGRAHGEKGDTVFGAEILKEHHGAMGIGGGVDLEGVGGDTERLRLVGKGTDVR